jgi:hypothetical protein
MRPTTFPHTNRLSTGKAQNFRELFIDPDMIAGTLKPSAPPQVPAPPEGAPGAGPSFAPFGVLHVRNDHHAFAVVSVGGTELGILGPFTEGVIEGVRSGTYEVGFTFPNGFSASQTLSATPTAGMTGPAPAAAAPGEGGEVSAEDIVDLLGEPAASEETAAPASEETAAPASEETAAPVEGGDETEEVSGGESDEPAEESAEEAGDEAVEAAEPTETPAEEAPAE